MLPAGSEVATETVVVPRAAVGRHVVKVVGRATAAEPGIPLGQITFNVPRKSLYDITGVLISPLPLAPALNISCETLLDGLTFLYLCEANNNISSISCFINNDTPSDCELERTFHLAATLLDSNCSEWCGM